MSRFVQEDIVQLYDSLEYPMDKMSLVDAVSKKHAPRNFLEQITSLPDEIFESPSDVSLLTGQGEWRVDDF